MILSKLVYRLEWDWYDISPKWFTLLIRKINQSSYWLAYRLWPKHQYHIVRTDLRPGYYDIDVLMEAAMVRLLRRYVEEEMDGADRLLACTNDLRLETNEPIEGALSEQINTQRSALRLYQWFVVDKPHDERKYAELIGQWCSSNHDEPISKPVPGTDLHELLSFPNGQDLYKQAQDLKHQIEEQTELGLHELVRIRQSLWT